MHSMCPSYMAESGGMAGKLIHRHAIPGAGQPQGDGGAWATRADAGVEPLPATLKAEAEGSSHSQGHR